MQKSSLADVKKNEKMYWDPRIRVSMWIIPGIRLIYGASRDDPLFIKDAKTPLSYAEATQMLVFETMYILASDKPALVSRDPIHQLRADLESVPIALSIVITPETKIRCFSVGQFFNALGWQPNGDPIWDERWRKGIKPIHETINTVTFTV